MPATEELCLACGLCCDGTLFHVVKLGPGDHAAPLKAAGLPVTTGRDPRRGSRFPQPCAALCADKRCRVYAERPLQCHVFECGVFKELATEKIGFAAALRLVRQARKRADNIRRLLRKMGDTAEGISLSQRFQRLQRRMEGASPDKVTAALYAELTHAVHHLNVLTHKRFYTKTDDERGWR